MNRLTLIALGAIIPLGLGVKLASSKPQTVAQPAQLLQPLSSTSPAPPKKLQAEPMSQEQSSAARKLPSIIISTCNGESGDANFRATPSMAKSAIVGVIKSGQQVYLTGRTMQADGEIWHEAIAPQFQSNQTGWIAGCFVI